jgi:hypothetical protein
MHNSGATTRKFFQLVTGSNSYFVLQDETANKPKDSP